MSKTSVYIVHNMSWMEFATHNISKEKCQPGMLCVLLEDRRFKSNQTTPSAAKWQYFQKQKEFSDGISYLILNTKTNFFTSNINWIKIWNLLRTELVLNIFCPVCKSGSQNCKRETSMHICNSKWERTNKFLCNKHHK